MIYEGTRVDSTQADSEERIKEVTKERVVKTKGLVVANFPVSDTDWMQSCFQDALKTDRALVANLKQTYRLERFRTTGIATSRIDDKRLGVKCRENVRRLQGRPILKQIQREDYDYWEHEFLDPANAASAKDIGEYLTNTSSVVISSNSKSGSTSSPAGSSYIRSAFKPFDLEMELDLKKAENRLARFGLHPYVQTHATGHPNYAEIRDAVRAVQPKALIPVHSQHPELFQNLHDNVIILEIGQEIVLAPGVLRRLTPKDLERENLMALGLETGLHGITHGLQEALGCDTQ